MTVTLPGERQPEKTTKMEAARRQLATAIALWFNGGDTVSIYTLSHAAYEVIHNITRPDRTRDLLFDSLVIKDEFRKEFNEYLRSLANFFKHAQRGEKEDPVLEFYPEASELFILFSLVGLSLVKIDLNDEETAFLVWLMLQQPRFLTENGRKLLSEHLPIEGIHRLRQLSRRKFFGVFMNARRAIAC